MSSNRVAKELEAALILQEMGSFSGNSGGVVGKKRKHSSTTTSSSDVNALVHGFQIQPPKRTVTPPSVIGRTVSPPPTEQQRLHAIVTPVVSPQRYLGESQFGRTVVTTSPAKRQFVAVGNVKPLAAPPRMHNFSNFQKNPNMQQLSLLSKKSLMSSSAKSIKTTTGSSTYSHSDTRNAFNSTPPLTPQVLSPQIPPESAPAPTIFCYPVGNNIQNDKALSSLLIQLPPSALPDIKSAPSIATTRKRSTNKIKTSATKKRKICKMEDCEIDADKRTPYCINHRGQRKCESNNCDKFAQSKTRFCIKHGGGRRCTFPNCNKGARDKFFCGAHGGGKRCTALNCPKLAVGGDNVCTAHGGGKRCQDPGCAKSAQSSSNFCVRHGGGRKCKFDGCQKVARGKMGLCMSHATATKEQQL
jgi:hypothetical protein